MAFENKSMPLANIHLKTGCIQATLCLRSRYAPPELQEEA